VLTISGYAPFVCFISFCIEVQMKALIILNFLKDPKFMHFTSGEMLGGKNPSLFIRVGKGKLHLWDEIRCVVLGILIECK
jgi:hypothetical protein